MAAVHRRIPGSPCVLAARAAISVNRTDAFRAAPPGAWRRHALYWSHIVRFDFETNVLRNAGEDLYVLAGFQQGLRAQDDFLAGIGQHGGQFQPVRQAHFVKARTHDFAEIGDVDRRARHALVEDKQRRARPIILSRSTRYPQDLLAVRRAQQSLISTGGAGRPRSADILPKAAKGPYATWDEYGKAAGR